MTSNRAIRRVLDEVDLTARRRRGGGAEAEAEPGAEAEAPEEEGAKSPATTVEEELEAMARCAAALGPLDELDDEARGRVWHWLADRFGVG
jgi:hypothetical protein